MFEAVATSDPDGVLYRAFPRVHDLVRIDPVAIVRLELREWARASLERTPWLVVRRAAESGGVAVGVRGTTRGERDATVIAPGDVVALRRPEDLVGVACSSVGPLADAARQVHEAAAEHELAWGPTGSYGFELASGAAVTRAESDLDCVVRASGKPPAALLAFAQRITALARSDGPRIDVELSFDGLGPPDATTPAVAPVAKPWPDPIDPCYAMGIALADYAGSEHRIVAKTPAGPVFIARSWLVCRA